MKWGNFVQHLKNEEQLWENNKAMWKAIEEQKQMRAAFHMI